MPITGHTALFAILADPVVHVKAPERLNRLWADQGFDGTMVPMQVPAEDLEAVVAGLRRMRNLQGLVITMPHKRAMAALCDELGPQARGVGAVNIVHRRVDGSLVGEVIDGIGFVAGLREAGLDPAGRSVYIAGAGGASSAIGSALADAGIARLTLANRTAETARRLADRLMAAHPSLPVSVGTRSPAGHDLVVNATSLGMQPGDPLPLDTDALDADQVVCEVIMQPAETPLLKAAAARGCRVQPGAPMLAAQLGLMDSFLRRGTLG